jgi:hypothetical protein
VMFKNLLNGTIKIAFQKQRLVSEAKPGHALDGSGFGDLHNHRRREGFENRSVTSPIEPLDFKLDDGAEAIVSRHHNEHLIIPIPCNPAHPE